MSLSNFDFIVVGGGCSGAILAGNLAKKGPTLLVERGPNATNFPQRLVPQGWPQIVAPTLKTLRAEDSGQWTGTSNVLGGGSVHNAAVCWRSDSYQVFEDLGFTRDQATNALDKVQGDLCEPAPDSDFNDAFIDAWKDQGYNVSDITTAGRAPSPEKEAGIHVRRASTLYRVSNDGSFHRTIATDYFESINPEMNKNLTVMVLTTAKKISFDEHKIATSVEAENPLIGNVTLSVRKGGKIFLNAGAFETPKLLMLSGIGPRNDLRRHGISVVHENPAVGQNAIDRKEVSGGIPMLRRLDGDQTGSLDFAAIAPEYWASFAHRQVTPWANPLFGCLTCRPENRYPECVNTLLAAMAFFGMGAVPPEFQEIAGFYVAQRNPATRGIVSLGSGDYRDNPIFHDGWDYTEPSPENSHDLDILTEGVDELLVGLLANGTLLQHFGHPIQNTSGPISPTTSTRLRMLQASLLDLEDQAPECSINQDWGVQCSTWEQCVPMFPPLPRSRETLRETIKGLMASSQHICGTAKVGEVVREQTLEVVGVKNLHVADLSVVAGPVDIHPMLTAMAISESVGRITQPIPLPEIEYGPVIVAITILCASIIFTVFTVYVVASRRKTSLSSSVGFAQDLSESGRQEGLNHKSLEFGVSESESFSDDASKSLEEAALMSWYNLGCSYQSKDKDGAPVTTLSGVSGVVYETELVAVMGPSGAGKSTLLDMLSRRKTLGQLKGEVSILGEHISDLSIGRKSISETAAAYIPQRESFFPTQTPVEAVAFVANLRLGKDPKGLQRRREFVSLVLQKVGLQSETRTRPIGGTLAGGLTVTGLSGGERKRLALACALAMKPKLIFLDELTSGLDSENALSTMTLVKRICRSERVAALVVIHQPSAQVFEKFDRLILLAKGRCVFSNKTSELEQFYNDTFRCPLPDRHQLPGDLLKRASTWRVERATKQKKEGELTISMSTQEDISSSRQVEEIMLVHTVSTAVPRAQEEVSMSWKFRTIFERNLLNQYIRNKTNLAARLFIYTALSLVSGAIYWQVAVPSDNDVQAAEQAIVVLGAFTYSLLISYLLPFATIPIFVHEKKFFVAESDLSLYPAWIYCVSQSILEAWVLVVAAFLETIIVAPMVGLWSPALPEWASFFTILSTLIASGLVGSANVLFNSVAMPTQDLAFLNGSGLVTICLAVSGGFVPLSELPPYISWLQWISPVKYSLQSLAQNQFEGSSLEIILQRYALDQPGTIGGNIVVLYAMYIGLTLLSMIALARQREVR